MDNFRCVSKLAYDNIIFLLLGIPCMYRELLFRVKRITDVPMQTGRTAIVTGGSRGIGYEFVRRLLELDMDVIVGSSNINVANEAMASLYKIAKCDQLKVWQLDLTSKKSIAEFCQRFLDTDTPLHLLVCNAGIMFYPEHKLTDDGFEMQLAVNHLGHMYMQHLLLSRLARSGTEDRKARIVNVASAAHMGLSTVNTEDILQSKLYSPKGAYFHSKGIQILCCKYLARLVESKGLPVLVSALHPGVIYTELYNNTTFYRFMGPLLKRVWKTCEDGAQTILFAALSPQSEKMNGGYFENASLYRAAKYTDNTQLQNDVWTKCCQLLQIEFE